MRFTYETIFTKEAIMLIYDLGGADVIAEAIDDLKCLAWHGRRRVLQDAFLDHVPVGFPSYVLSEEQKREVEKK